MKRLHEKVNIIPLIAKADTLTPEECQQFKKQVSLMLDRLTVGVKDFTLLSFVVIIL